MKIYTRTGDAGTTGLFGGPRVAKDDTRIEAYGTVDELNAVIGVARSQLEPGWADIDEQLRCFQHELFSIGAELASPDPDAFDLRLITQHHVERIEGWIDDLEKPLPPLKQFILPAGHPASAAVHHCRGVCRRAERRVVTLSQPEMASESPPTSPAPTTVSQSLIHYLNRLSDYLFVLSRSINHRAGHTDEPWVKPDSGSSQAS
ncbi:MAG: cob(I)yrinic acid a,c-diamide adenosyltransferase [Planctomycetota bacterium]